MCYVAIVRLFVIELQQVGFNFRLDYSLFSSLNTMDIIM